MRNPYCTTSGFGHMPLVLVLLLCPPEAFAQRFSSSVCTVTARSEESITQIDGFANSLVDISEFICGESSNSDGVIEIEREVSAVATAVAEVVTEITYDCSLSGNSFATVSATTQAVIQARAVGQAVATVLSGSAVCGDCTAKIDSFVNATQETIVQVTQNVFFTESFMSTPDMPVEVNMTFVQRRIEKDTREAIARISLTVRRTDFDCSVSGTAMAQVGDDSATCDFTADGASRIVEEDAIIRLAVEARTFVCNDGFSEDSVAVTLSATATALAEAISQVDVRCSSVGGPQTAGCAIGVATVTAAARATASSFVQGLAEAGTCFCNETVSLNETAFQEIFAQASAEAYERACTSGTGSDFMMDIQMELDEQMFAAVAVIMLEVRALADSDSGECFVSRAGSGAAQGVSTPVPAGSSPGGADPTPDQAISGPVPDDASSIQGGLGTVCAGVTECAKDHQQCRGEEVSDDGLQVLPCCSPDFVCVRRNSVDARCQREGTRLPTFYDGTIEPPTVVPPTCP